MYQADRAQGMYTTQATLGSSVHTFEQVFFYFLFFPCLGSTRTEEVKGHISIYIYLYVYIHTLEQQFFLFIPCFALTFVYV